MGKLANYVERKEEMQDAPQNDIKEKVIPDLLVYACWLAKEFNVKITDVYVERIMDNLGRLHKRKLSEEELNQLKEYEGRFFY